MTLRTVLLIFLIGYGSAAHAQIAETDLSDQLVSDFHETAVRFVERLAGLPSIPECPNPSLLRQYVSIDPREPLHTRIHGKPVVYVEGREQEASNQSSPNLIQLNRSKMILQVDPLLYVTLMLHEYEGVMGLEGTNDNSKSSACINAMQRSGLSLIDFLRMTKRKSPLDTFSSDFWNGIAGFFCSPEKPKIEDSFLFYVQRPLRLDAGVSVARFTPDQAIQFIRSGDGIPGSHGINSTEFNSVYSIETGRTEFTAHYRGRNSHYYFSSSDAQVWRVEIEDLCRNGRHCPESDRLPRQMKRLARCQAVLLKGLNY